jgi:hypothetical protein
MARATGSRPARRHSRDRLRGKAQTRKPQIKEIPKPKYKLQRSTKISRGLQSPFLLTRLVHFLAAIWHNLSPPLTFRWFDPPAPPRVLPPPTRLRGVLPRNRADFSVGWYLRKRGKDLLSLKFDRGAATYWIERNPPGPAPGSLTKQF